MLNQSDKFFILEKTNQKQKIIEEKIWEINIVKFFTQKINYFTNFK